MEVWLSILLAAIAGGVAFMLLDSWQRRRVAPAEAATAPIRPDPSIWTPITATEPRRQPIWTPDEDTSRAAWGPPAPVEEETQPLPPAPEPRRESPPLWTPPPGSRSGHWDDDDRYRDEDDDDRPPGLWSGWANR